MNKFFYYLLYSLAVASFTLETQAQLRVEYFFDSDPGFRRGTWVTGSTDADGNIAFPASTDGLAPGTHLLGFRVYPANKKEVHCSPTITKFIVVEDNRPQFVNRVEYFWDEDPGFGNGISVSNDLNSDYFIDRPPIGENSFFYYLNDNLELILSSLQISTENLTDGSHVLGIRVYGSDGWSPTVIHDIVVKRSTENDVIFAAEFFWDEDPGYGQGAPIDIVSGKEIEINEIITTDNIHGDATLYIRTLGSGGWSPTIGKVVMVDVAGDYTLNNHNTTNIIEHQYSSIDDTFVDFNNRGIGGDVTLNVTSTNTEYTLDTTTDDMLSRLQSITNNIENISTSKKPKTILFKALSNSGNSINVTTSDEGLPIVVSLFAHTTLENVSLFINGTEYDFTVTNVRNEELDADEASSLINLSEISSDITSKWKALPHEGTTITGYISEGVGDLPSMRLRNRGNETDSIDYQITLTNSDEKELLSYIYTIYVAVSDTPFVIGDANDDEVINIADVISLINYILGNRHDNFVFENADINGDGEITITDVITIINMILENKDN